MKSKILKTTAILLILAGSVSCGKKDNTNECVCNVNNPLTDLTWLEEIVLNQAQYPGIYLNIHQCTYNEGTDGFCSTLPPH